MDRAAPNGQRGSPPRLTRVTRISTGSDGETHFGEVEIALADAGRSVGSPRSCRQRVSSSAKRLPGTTTIGTLAPRRQYLVLLDGEIEITVGDGEVRRFRGGDVLLMEDTTGRGHRTRTVDGRVRRSVFITLD